MLVHSLLRLIPYCLRRKWSTSFYLVALEFCWQPLYIPTLSKAKHGWALYSIYTVPEYNSTTTYFWRSHFKKETVIIFILFLPNSENLPILAAPLWKQHNQNMLAIKLCGTSLISILDLQVLGFIFRLASHILYIYLFCMLIHIKQKLSLISMYGYKWVA